MAVGTTGTAVAVAVAVAGTGTGVAVDSPYFSVATYGTKAALGAVVAVGEGAGGCGSPI